METKLKIERTGIFVSVWESANAADLIESAQHLILMADAMTTKTETEKTSNANPRD